MPWPWSSPECCPENEAAAGERTRLLEDKLFRVRVLDTGGEACYTFRNGLFRPVFRPEREPDLAFAANLSAYLQMLARQEDPDTLFFNRELEITGDTELGLIVKNMLDAIEWPQLSASCRYCGTRAIDPALGQSMTSIDMSSCATLPPR